MNLKGQKLLAGILAALMTASSAGITAFAEEEGAVLGQLDIFEEIETDASCIEENIEEDNTATLGTTQSVNNYAAQIGNDGYASLADAMASLSGRTGDIVIKLSGGNVYYEFNAWNDFTKSYAGGTITFEGTEENRATVLNLHGKDTDHSAVSNATKLIFKNLTINKTNANDNGGAAWNRHALNFEGDVEFENVNVNTEVAVGGASTFKNVNFTETNAQYTLWIKSSASGEIIVDNCTFTAANNGRGIKIGDQYTGDNSRKVNLTVKNSVFNTAKKAAVLVSNLKGANITAYGNNISGVSEDSTNLVWIDDGTNPEKNVSYSESINKIIVRDENGKIINTIKVENGDVITNTAVAEINGKEYSTLSAAVSAAKSNETVEVIKDIRLKLSDLSYQGNYYSKDYYRYCFISGKTITIDLNGYTIDLDETAQLYDQAKNAVYQLFYIYNGANVTVTGNGTINSNPTTNVDNYIFVLADSTNVQNVLNFENGTYYGECVVKNYSFGNRIYVKGGVYGLPARKKAEAPENAKGVLNTTSSGNIAIWLTGGTIIGCDPRDMDDGDMVTDGYLVTRKGNEYTVIPNENIEATILTAGNRVYSYTSLADAVANAKDGDTVTLLRDASGDGMVVDKDFTNAGLTIDLGGHTYTISGKAVGSNGSETNGFQLVRYYDADNNTYTTNNITIKNGTINSTDSCDTKNGQVIGPLSIVIQNYANLNLYDVTLDGSKLLHSNQWTPYTLSNCNGNINIERSTITVDNGYAFDVDNKPGYDGVTVTIDVDSVVKGYVQIARNVAGATKRATLKIGSLSYSDDVKTDYLKVGDMFVKVNKTDIDSRSIEVFVDRTSVKAGEEVKATVKLKGSNLAYASYELSYDTAMFDLKNENRDIQDNNGTISFSKQSGVDQNGNATVFACGEDGYVLAEYTFVARAQGTVAVGDFTLNKTKAYTYDESIKGLSDIEVSNNNKASVTIDLGRYTATVKVDGNTVAEAEKSIPYDGNAHTVVIDVTPRDYREITYSYKKDGATVTEPDFKEIGRYEIEYTVVSDGYEPLTRTFTLEITAPTAYYVEVNTADATPEAKTNDYVAGKKLILVYTDLDGVAFRYGNYDMINVSKTYNEYEYDKTKGSDNTVTQTNFKYVYAYVADKIADGTVESYKNVITPFVIENGYEVPKLASYDEDININGVLDSADTTTEYGVWGVFGSYFTFESASDSTFKQLRILKADVNGDKAVTAKDVQRVDLAVRNQ